MKLSLQTKILAVCFTAICISFSSCVDESIDLNKLSTDMKFGGSLATPLGEMTVSMQDIMDDFVTDSTAQYAINERNGVVNLYFSDTLLYDNPAGVDFSTFGAIHKNIVPGVDPELPPIVIPAGDHTYTIIETYDFNDINVDTTEQRVDSIRFTNTTISATINTNLPPGFVSIDIELPVEFEGESGQVIEMDLTGPSTTREFTVENFIVRSENGKTSTTFPINVIIHGDGVTALNGSHFIDINVSLKDTKFTAYGYFNYGTDLVPQDESIDIDLKSILGDSVKIYPHNPEVQFDLTSNIGVPLLFNLKELKSYENSAIPVPLDKTATFNGLPAKTFDIDRATTVGSEKTSTIILDKEIANGKTADLFKINVDSASAKFSFGVKSDHSVPQFVTSDSKIKVKLGINMPFWLDEKSTISVTDTIWDVYKTLNEIFDNSEVKEAVIRVKYSNMLPIGATAYLRLLGTDTLTVPSSSLYTYEIKSAPVDASGATIAPGTEKTFDIKFDSSNIEQLKKTKHIKMTIKAEGYDYDTSKIKFRVSDWIKIKLSAYVIGEGHN